MRHEFEKAKAAYEKSHEEMRTHEEKGETLRVAGEVRLGEIRADFNEVWKYKVSVRELRTALKDQKSSWREENVQSEKAWVKMLRTQEERSIRETKNTIGDIRKDVAQSQRETRLGFPWRKT